MKVCTHSFIQPREFLLLLAAITKNPNDSDNKVREPALQTTTNRKSSRYYSYSCIDAQTGERAVLTNISICVPCARMPPYNSSTTTLLGYL